jgi:hypothetical protein
MNRHKVWMWPLTLLVFIAVGAGCREQALEPPKGEVPDSSPSQLPPPLSPEPVPVSDEACSAEPGTPKPTQLFYQGPIEAEYGDSLPLAALLTDKTGQPLVGRELRFVLGTLEASAATDELGLAQVTLTPTGIPAALPLQVSFAGDAALAPASVSATVVITRADTVTHFLGPTVFPTGTPQQVRATLMDADDRTPIAGRTLIFEAGGARYGHHGRRGPGHRLAVLEHRFDRTRHHEGLVRWG